MTKSYTLSDESAELSYDEYTVWIRPKDPEGDDAPGLDPFEELWIGPDGRVSWATSLSEHEFRNRIKEAETIDYHSIEEYESIKPTVPKDDRGKLVQAMREVMQLPYDDFGREEWLQCLRDAGVSDETVSHFEAEFDKRDQEYGSAWNPRSGGRTLSRIFRKLPNNHSFDDCLRCPECGSVEIENLNYDYHEAVVGCSSCGEIAHYSA